MGDCGCHRGEEKRRDRWRKIQGANDKENVIVDDRGKKKIKGKNIFGNNRIFRSKQGDLKA